MLRKRLHKEREPSLLVNNENNICEHLAYRLSQNELALFLGSGVSAPLNVPTWEMMVKGCCDKKNIDHHIELESNSGVDNPAVSREYLLDLMDQVRRQFEKNEHGYRELIKDILYKDIKVKIQSDPLAFLKTELLIAIGFLISGSENGHVSEIITYNFDGILEWYLGLLGFKVNPIQKIPSVLNNSDVNIYHPHGFLPLIDIWEQSDFVIFDKKSYEERFDPIHPATWWKLLEQLMYSKQFLFIGIRELDPTLGPILRGVKKQIVKSGTDRKIIGFWAFPENEKNKTHSTRILEYGCVPFYYKSYEDIPLLLLKIRQISAELIL